METSETSKLKTETLLGGRSQSVCLEDGTILQVKVRQLRLDEYERAYPLLTDEFAFTAFCCSPGSVGPAPSIALVPYTRDWIMTLDPESYEALQLAAREVNAKGFFFYAQRRQAVDQAEADRQYQQFAELPPDIRKEFVETGLGMKERSTSPTPSPRPRRV